MSSSDASIEIAKQIVGDLRRSFRHAAASLIPNADFLDSTEQTVGDTPLRRRVVGNELTENRNADGF